MLIPLELWRIIAYELQRERERESLVSLCLTSAALNDAIAPILYSWVELPTMQSVRLFCHTPAYIPKRFRPFIQCLKIGSYHNYRQWNRVELSPSLAKDLVSELKGMPLLWELTVALKAGDFSACFDPLTVKPPFTIQKLVIPLMGITSLYEFLKSQPSIKELHIGSEHTVDEYCFGDCLSRQPEFLPNLTSIAAPIFILKGAVPGRPISHVAIIAELLDWTDSGITIIAPSTWEPILCGSRVPITGVSLYHSPHSADPWEQLVPALKQFGVHKTLRKLDFVEALDPPVTEWSKQESLSQRVKQMKALTEFDQLGGVDFGEMPYIPSRIADVISWLGNMNSLAAWKMYIPSLDKVKMYGVNIC